MRRLRSHLYTTTCTLAVAIAMPVTAWANGSEKAEEESDGAYREMSVEAGAEYVTDSSLKFGEYTGLIDEGFYAIGNIELYYRSPYDSETGAYGSLTGYNLGLESRDVYAEYGHQGLFSVEAFYDQTPHYYFDDAVTPYLGVGTDNLVLPGFWVPATNTAGFTELDNANHPLEFSLQRDKFGGRFNVSLSDHWHLHLGARHENKEGTNRIWGIFGTNGGNPAAVLLPEPIDWQTSWIEGGIGYKSRELQVNLLYEASYFNNENASLTWENAFSGAPSGAPWSPVVGYPEPGRMSLVPDNQAHYFTFTGAYRFSPSTRVTSQFRYIRSTQDETLLPYTVNPFLLVPEPLPRDSAEAEITDIRGDIRLVSRLSDRSTFRIQYTYDDRDNNTPQNVFLRVPNDTANQGALDSSQARINLPYSFRNNEVEASISYRAYNWLNLEAIYNFEDVAYTFQDVTSTQQNTGEIRANFHPGGYANGRVQGWVKVSYASRTNDGRQANRSFLESHTLAFLATEVPRAPFTEIFENHPELQPYYTAARDELTLHSSFTFLPTQNSSVTLYAKWLDANYDDSEPFVLSTLGLREQDGLQLSVDASINPTQRTQLFANYVYENLSRLVVNHQFMPFPPLNGLTEPTQRWSQDVTDEIHTVGAGFKWKSESGRFAFTSTYHYQLADTSWDIAAGSELTFAPYPVVESERHRVDAYMDFKIIEGLKTRISYIFEDLDTADWAYEGITQTATGTDLVSGHQPWDYSVHVIGLSAIKKF